MRTVSTEGNITLVDRRGRKYLTAIERQRFVEVAETDPIPAVQTFTLVLAYTGCRISEALALCHLDIDMDNLALRFKTLKRRQDVWREVAVPQDLIRAIDLAHSVRASQSRPRRASQRIWDFSRSTASRHVKRLMTKADIKGPQASAKGLRHGFGVAAIEAGVPLPTIATVLGHANIETTAIYTTAIGMEAREQLARMWQLC